ncbi:MAG: hypothetical protein ABI851_02715 [Saprospiraceae bacterium]
MKKFKLNFLVLLGIFISSCNLYEDNCDLIIKVVDTNGDPVEGAYIEAYSSPSKNSDVVGISFSQTDYLGVATIVYNPKCLDYYKLIAYKGCSSNEFALNSSNINKLIKANSTVNCILEETSTIVLKSNSSLQNKIFLNGSYLFEMNTNTTKTITVVAKNNKIRVEESDIFNSNPIKSTYDVTSTCGEIKILEFK